MMLLFAVYAAFAIAAIFTLDCRRYVSLMLASTPICFTRFSLHKHYDIFRYFATPFSLHIADALF